MQEAGFDFEGLKKKVKAVFDEVTFLIGSRRLEAKAIRNELIEFIYVYPDRYYEERLCYNG